MDHFPKGLEAMRLHGRGRQGFGEVPLAVEAADPGRGGNLHGHRPAPPPGGLQGRVGHLVHRQ
eukprot:3211819-Lingulodinium_polyedra.AAC.1